MTNELDNIILAGCAVIFFGGIIYWCISSIIFERKQEKSYAKLRELDEEWRKAFIAHYFKDK
jgi:hypothetical protein